jgi:type VI protein secretion system component VasK
MSVFLVLGALGVGFLFSRKKTNQIMQVIALSVLLGGALRLFQVQDNNQTLWTVGVLLGGLGLIWLITWVSNRTAMRRSKRVDPTKPRIDPGG